MTLLSKLKTEILHLFGAFNLFWDLLKVMMLMSIFVLAVIFLTARIYPKGPETIFVDIIWVCQLFSFNGRFRHIFALVFRACKVHPQNEISVSMLFLSKLVQNGRIWPYLIVLSRSWSYLIILG